ncbi:GNAT family N-acetyltransferase [Lewinella sp. W8]|uniref:GNAT family N-acetyltransferase n=1 Tax=Lewinella sp. W8 TaxID=2528208 RepID=UPI0010688DB6|nr:GNAT family N-acetyltransferase [Lewinella sp. W8]MTB52918.1 GNAT family N-acetyltransferase [Lewinella sp. W8]
MIAHSHGYLRPLDPDDVEEFIRLRREGFASAPLSFEQSPDDPIDPDLWRERLGADPANNVTLGFFLTAAGDEREELVGIWGVKRYAAPKRAHRAMMWGVYVSDRARGLGVGRALMQEALRRCREMPGLEHVILTVSHHATAAIKLYREAGFVEFGREIGAAKTGNTYMDEVYMRLDLG